MVRRVNSHYHEVLAHKKNYIMDNQDANMAGSSLLFENSRKIRLFDHKCESKLPTDLITTNCARASES